MSLVLEHLTGLWGTKCVTGGLRVYPRPTAIVLWLVSIIFVVPDSDAQTMGRPPAAEHPPGFCRPVTSPPPHNWSPANALGALSASAHEGLGKLHLRPVTHSDSAEP